MKRERKKQKKRTKNKKQSSRKKQKSKKILQSSQQIVSYCFGLRTQNPGLREVDLEPSPKKGSDRINLLTKRKATEKSNKSCRTAWTHERYPVLREVDLEPSPRYP